MDIPTYHISPRHHQVILLAALGNTNVEIAQRTKYSPVRVGQLLAMPHIRSLVEIERQRFHDRLSLQVQDDLLRDAPTTFRRLQKIRDNVDDEVAIKGAIPLWDRQVPKRTIHDETHITKIILERRDVQYLKQVEAEADVLEGEGTDAAETPDGSA